MRVAVVQVAPACRQVGAFTVRGHRGVNRVPFRARLHGRPLPLGTYRIIARSRGRTLLGVTLVVVAKRPSPQALARARATDACATMLVTRAIPLQLRGPVGTRVVVGGTPSVAHAKSGSAVASGTAASVLPRGQALGAQFGKSTERLDATKALLIAAAALAVLLLGLAALPEAALTEPRLAALVGTRRTELALAGVSTLLVAVVVYLVAG